MATVRTSDNVELLILSKRDFLDLDKATLNIIQENARYNAACTKEPSQRTRDDLQILQQRTAHLSHLSSLSTEVHMELCRVMRYRKVRSHHPTPLHPPSPPPPLPPPTSSRMQPHASSSPGAGRPPSASPRSTRSRC